MEERDCQRIILDEFDVSHALWKALSIGKKLEEFDLIINETKDRFEYGADFKKVKKILGAKQIEAVLPLRIRVKVYFFSHGENCYTMQFEQKARYCDLKKPKIAVLLKEGDFLRAQKLLLKVREMTEKVDRHQRSPEDIQAELDRLAAYRKSALMNLTLCQWKLGLWSDLLATSATVLQEIDPSNPKIFYRHCLALFEKKDFHLLLAKHKDFLQANPAVETDFPELAVLREKAAAIEQKIKSKEKQMYAGLLHALTE